MGIFDNEKEDASIIDEDYDLLAWENKRMAEFLVSMGLSNDSVGDRVINGTDADVDVARDIITEKIVYSIKEKLSEMDSDGVLSFIRSERNTANGIV